MKQKPTKVKAHIAKKTVPRTDAMALFGCIFVAPGHVVAPAGLATLVRRGSNFRAAAFRTVNGDGHVFVVRAFTNGTELQVARNSVMQQLTYSGTIGKNFPGVKLKLQEFRAFDAASVPYYTPEEILYDTGLLRAQMALAPAQAPNTVNHYEVLGLAEGASWEAVKQAFRRKAFRLHPDKGGDCEEFDRVYVSYDALNALNAGTAVHAAPETVIKALPYEADATSHEAMWKAAFDRVVFCEGLLKAAKQQLAQVAVVAGKKLRDVEQTTMRTKAQRFVLQHFKGSARYWDPAHVMCWFRPQSGFPPLDVNLTQPSPERDQWIAACDAYGEELRMSNEDLDPAIKFLAWTSNHRFQGDVAFRIKVGLDYEDIVDHGIELVVGASRLTSGMVPCAKTLVRLGWNQKDARSLTYGGWLHDFDVTSCMSRVEEASSSRKRLRIEVESEEAVNPEVAELLRQYKLKPFKI